VGVVTIDAPIRLMSSANLREHWATKARRVARERRELELFVPFHPFPLPCVVTLTRIAPRPLDDDNLVSCFKGCRDSLAVRLGVPDDRDPRVVWKYDQRRGRPKFYGVRITFQEMEVEP